MITLPVLETPRLLLRPFALADAERVRLLAGSREVAKTTLNIPHPYPEGAAEAWIAHTHEGAASGRLYSFAVVRRAEGDLVGCMALNVNQADNHGELAYWIGVPYWRQGYASEAAKPVVAFGFEQLKLSRIWAVHLGGNPASGRVMQKVGMKLEGTQRQHVEKWGEIHDRVLYGMLRSEFEA